MILCTDFPENYNFWLVMKDKLDDIDDDIVNYCITFLEKANKIQVCSILTLINVLSVVHPEKVKYYAKIIHGISGDGINIKPVHLNTLLLCALRKLDPCRSYSRVLSFNNFLNVSLDADFDFYSYRSELYHPFCAISRDDLDSFIVYVYLNGLDNMLTFRDSFSNINIQPYDADLLDSNMLDAAAYFSAVKCFKFLIKNGFEVRALTVRNAILSESLDILEIIYSLGFDFSTLILHAIKHYKNNIVYWIVDNYDISDVSLLKSFGVFNFIIMHYYVHNATDINTTDSRGRTALHMASMYGLDDFIKIMIEKGADVNRLDSSNLSPIHYSLIGKNVSTFILLAENGADINFTTPSGMSVVHIAVSAHLTQIIRYLHKRNVFLDPVDLSGYTPLYLAAYHGDSYIMILLVKYGADINTKDKNGNGILHYLTVTRKAKLVEKLLKLGAYVDIRDQMNRTPLIIAIENHFIEVASLLMSFGADVNASYDGGYSPLFFAARSGTLEIVNLLIVHNVDLNLVYVNGFTPLHFAVKYNTFDVCECLVKAGSDVNSLDIYGNTPLIYSIQSKNVKVTELLLMNKADPNIVCADNSTPLSIAILNNLYDIAELLLNFKADINCKLNGVSLLQYCDSSNRLELSDLIKKYC